MVQDAYVTLLLNNYAWYKVIFRCKLDFSSIIALKNSKEYMTTVADHIWLESIYVIFLHAFSKIEPDAKDFAPVCIDSRFHEVVYVNPMS